MPAKSRIKKMTLWILLFALAISGLIVGGVGYYINKTNNVRGELADFILANSESTAVVAYTFDENGEYIADEYAIFYNADQSLIMASTMKIVVLAGYADAVASGEINPNEQVVVEDWERYYLPMTDGGAHVMGLKSIGLEPDENGFARDQTAMVALDDLARMMMHYSGNAATDYLIVRIGVDRLAAVMQKAGLKHHTPIGLTLGFALATFNHENPTFSTSQLQPLIAEVSNGDTSRLDHLIGLYLHDQQWRALQIEFITSLNQLAINSSDMWAYQTMASQLLPKGTAREYAQMMARIASGRFISPEVSEIMQQKLETVSSDWPLRLLFYNRFGAKDGATAGVLTIASYAVPKRGPISDHSRVIVIVTSQLPPEDWAEQVQYQGHYLLPIDLAQATGVFDKFTSIGN